MDTASKEDRCLHYIGWHANAYGAPADTETIQAIMAKHQKLDESATIELLDSLKEQNKVDYWTGKYTEGWIIPDA